jgi:hypothetical protein
LFAGPRIGATQRKRVFGATQDLDGPLPEIPERQFALSGLGNTRNI